VKHTRLGDVGVIGGDRIDWTDPIGQLPQSDDRMLSRRRRVVAASIAGVAVAVQLAVAVAWWNPWRFIHLMTSTHDWHRLGVLVGSVVMLGAAGWLGMRSRAAVRAMVSFAVLVLLAITVFVMVADLTGDIGTLDREGPRVVAISPDGRYEIVVTYLGDLTGAETAVLRVRSRNGLLSRESAEPGCVQPSVSSERAVVSVAFTSPQEITISADGGRTWQARFDPETLRPTASFGLPCR
jgi:hypothetical protein